MTAIYIDRMTSIDFVLKITNQHLKKKKRKEMKRRKMNETGVANILTIIIE
jgi:hypothetical protein